MLPWQYLLAKGPLKFASGLRALHRYTVIPLRSRLSSIIAAQVAAGSCGESISLDPNIGETGASI